MKGALQNLHSLLRASLPHTQLGRTGAAEVLSTSGVWRHQHTSAEVPSRTDPAPSPEQSAAQPAKQPAQQPGVDDDMGPPPPLRFVSREWPAVGPPASSISLPERRLPICFPNLTLQMLRLSPEQTQQVKETGWLREVAFKTTPDVTKLEIAAYLESLYGMSVEHVNTINYLGRRRVVQTRANQIWYRDDDWKKAYVIFRPPPGLEHLMTAAAAAGGGSSTADGKGEEEEERPQRPLIEEIREAARAPQRARRRWKRSMFEFRLKGELMK